jgi:epoxyqueuosine reductase QueG
MEAMVDKLLRDEIERFVREEAGNRFPDGGETFFDMPLIGLAAADDPLWQQYKQVIGEFHRTPTEILTGAATVISWVLPISRPTRESNRRETVNPSLQWAQTRSFGDRFNIQLRRHVVAWLEERGYRAVAPQLDPAWQELSDTPVGIASTWSERHAAYVAGLGTFSLNDALITPRGIAHRLGSVITDLRLAGTVTERPGFRDYCLYYLDGSCGACITRCPVKALSFDGHNKGICRTYVYQTLNDLLAEQYHVPITGCGLCQTKVPCEQQIPGKG